jgi:hypothetical protein
MGLRVSIGAKKRVSDPNLRDKSPKRRGSSKGQKLYKERETHLKRTRIHFGVSLFCLWRRLPQFFGGL